MSAITTFFTELRNDEDGASFLEYTVLLGIILAVSIAVLTAVGGYANQSGTSCRNHVLGGRQGNCRRCTS
jgi:Flp pilus assembly pilin Flp